MDDRKRQREEDFEPRPEDDKRSRDDPINELISNVCKDIRRIGETSNLQTQVDDMSYISNPIVVEFEKIDRLRAAVLSTMHAIVTEQPQKISSLSALVLICNAKNFLVAKYVVEFFHTKLQDYLLLGDSDNLNHIKNILKFLCSLSPILEDGALKSILLQFFTLCNELDAGSFVAQEIFYNTLIVLPYLTSFDGDNISLIRELLEKAESFVPDHKNVLLYSFFHDKKGNVKTPYHQTPLADLIFPAVKETVEKEDSPSLFIDYNALISPVIEEALKSNTISNEIVKHKLPQLAIPTDKIKKYQPKVGIDAVWASSPRLAFELYSHTTTEFETLPPITSYAGLFFRDVCTDLITNLSFNKNEALIQLSIMDLYFNRQLFCPPGSSIDTVKAINQDNVAGENIPALSTWKIEDVTVESILSLIFLTPTTPNLEIYYHLVLISCCKENPEAIAPVFGRAIRFLYSNLEALDYEARTKFLDWMTVQISNFDFSWKWDEWVDDSKKYNASKFQPKKSFIKNLITKELKLSNKKKIKESFVTVDPESGDVTDLDEFFQYLDLALIANPFKFIISYDSELYGNDDTIKENIAKTVYTKKETLSLTSSAQTEMIFVFGNDIIPYFHVCEKFHKFLMANSRSNKDFADVLEEVKLDITSDSIDKLKFMVNLVIQTYCHIGSRSIYSTISIMSRDLVKLKWFAGQSLGEEDYVGNTEEFRLPDNTQEKLIIQNYIVDAVQRLWVHRPQFVFLILEFLVNSKILDFDVFVDRIFDASSNSGVEVIDAFEALSRLVAISSDKAPVVTKIITKVTANLETVLQQLEIPDDGTVAISEYSEEIASKCDLEWLYYDYIDLFKWLVRKYGKLPEFNNQINLVLEPIKNVNLKTELSSYIEQLI